MNQIIYYFFTRMLVLISIPKRNNIYYTINIMLAESLPIFFRPMMRYLQNRHRPAFNITQQFISYCFIKYYIPCE